MGSKITTSDIFDINKKTGALMIGKNRLDDYATKFLTKYCKEALIEPMPLPILKIINQMKLDVQEVTLSSNMDIFGCCLLADGFVEIYDVNTKNYISNFYKEGTILIDFCCSNIYGEGFKRNTLVHEIIHWEKDKAYFNILKIKEKSNSQNLKTIMCRQSETYFQPSDGKKTKENELQWLEWQAHKLAPRVLMPINSFKKKTKQLISKCKSCDELINELSLFFITSRESVKYRLLEIGMKDVISEFSDFIDVYPEKSNNLYLIKLTPVEAFKLVNSDDYLKKWIESGNFVFVEGYFVLVSQKFIEIKNDEIKLTKKAKRNLSQCVINICEQRYINYTNLTKDYAGYSYLKKVEGIDNRLLIFHPKYQANFKYEEDDVYKYFANHIIENNQDEEIKLQKMLGDPEETLCNCLSFLMINRGWECPEDFNDKTELHKNYYGKIKNNNSNNMGTQTLMAICIGLKLPLRITEKLFEKSNNKLNYYANPDKTYIHIMESMPGLSLMDFNSILEKLNIQKLETKSKE